MKPETIQEEEYDFPYHHLVSIQPFSETQHLFWGYKYAAYLEKILGTLQTFEFKSLIDIGCGDGKVLIEVAKRFQGKRLVGTDYSEKSLQFARAFAPQLTWQTKTDEKFDGFVLVEVLEHINPAEMESFLDSICNNLNPGGFGIITTPCVNVPINPKHYQHFNKEKIDATLGKHFEILSFEYTSAQGMGVSIMRRLLANRFFILNAKAPIRLLYNWYKKHYLQASAHNATQVFVVVRKK
jgi:SAM-dependent methyltransferase